jgi:hypothetical protein
MTKTTMFGASLAAVSTLMLAPASADASDDKSFHAATCMAADGVESDWNRSLYRITRTGSSGNGQLYCPIVRDVFSCGGLIGGCVAGGTLRVFVQDQHSGAVQCTMSTRYNNGNSFFYTSASSSGGATPIVINYSRPTGDGQYALMCSAPPNGSAGYTRIHGYKLEEWD